MKKEQNTAEKQARLPKSFFTDNPLEELSAAQLTYFQMVTIDLTELNDKIKEIVIPYMDPDRKKAYEAERGQIAGASSGQEIIGLMRKMKAVQNQALLVNKALELQDEVAPLLFERLRKSAHDVFIENAAIFLANADEEYTEELYRIFHEIRSPYARSEASLVFGVRKRVEYTDLLLEQFARIKQECPGKGYEQGPLLALYLIYDQ